MREILFRGKKTTTGAWIYGSLIGDSIICQNRENPVSNGEITGWVFAVDPETVGQFTGLKVGETKVYEGDQIEDCGVVVWMHEALGWFVDLNGYYTPLYDLPIIIVTGNIHDTPQEGGPQ